MLTYLKKRTGVSSFHRSHTSETHPNSSIIMSILPISFLLLLSTAFVSCNPHPLAGSLLKRSARPGLALNAGWDGTSYKCAPGSNPTVIDKYCCPDGYSLNTDMDSFTSLICCPTGTNCRADVLQCPRCADTEWTYWDINGTNVSRKSMPDPQRSKSVFLGTANLAFLLSKRMGSWSAERA